MLLLFMLVVLLFVSPRRPCFVPPHLISLRSLGRAPDIFYSHITSQVNADVADTVLQDAALKAVLTRAKQEGRCVQLGTSCSFPAVVRAALLDGRLDHISVVQLAARTCISDLSLVCELARAGKMVVVNSPVRQLLRTPNEEITDEAVRTSIEELIASCGSSVSVVLAGTGNAVRLSSLAAHVTTAVSRSCLG